jgi:hypothetical protein
MYKTTKKDFELFKEYFNSYLVKLGLSFDVQFYHSNHKDVPFLDFVDSVDTMKSRFAQVTMNDDTFNIKVYLFKEHVEEVTKENIKKYALHEACHILIAQLRKVAKAQMEGKRVEGIEEALVEKLTNLLI